MIEITADYLRSQRISKTFPFRFWSKVRIAENGCWIWMAGIDASGYGSIVSGVQPRRSIRSHVASWILTHGPIPIGLFVLHNCPIMDNKLCVNPLHLYLGTQQDNGRDRRFKCQACAGERRPNHKLNWSDVKVIRASTMSQAALSSRFHVHQSIISEVISFKRWRRPF